MFYLVLLEKEVMATSGSYFLQEKQNVSKCGKR